MARYCYYYSQSHAYPLPITGKVCPVLDIREAQSNDTNVEYETVVEFTCNIGFILAHNHTADDMISTCLHTATWDKIVPDCRGNAIISQ